MKRDKPVEASVEGAPVEHDDAESSTEGSAEEVRPEDVLVKGSEEETGMTESAQRNVEKKGEKSGGFLVAGKEQVAALGTKAKAGVEKAADTGRETLNATGERIRDGASEAAKRAKQGASTAAERAREGAGELAERAKSGASRAAEHMPEGAKQAAGEGLQRAGKFGDSVGSVMRKGWSKVSGGERAEFQLESSRSGLELSQLSEERQLAFFGALFAMAGTDGDIDRDEIYAVFEILENDGLGEEARRRLRSYIVDPPELEDCLEPLAEADERVRYALMINLVEVTRADDFVAEGEERGLEVAQEKLGVSDEERAEIENFVDKIQQVRERGIDDDKAAQAIQSAVAGLAGVGVPVAAISVSGSIAGLSAAGITSGLAALGLGLGMAPGIGAAVFIGTVTYLGAKHVMGTERRRRQQSVQAERERRAQRLVENLHETIEHLTTRVDELRRSAETAEANREAIEKLTARLEKLKRVLEQQADDEIEGE